MSDGGHELVPVKRTGPSPGRSRPATAEAGEMLRTAADVVLGAAGLISAALISALREATPRAAEPQEVASTREGARPPGGPVGLLRRAPGAALSAGLGAARQVARVPLDAAAQAARLATSAPAPGVVKSGAGSVRSSATELQDLARAAQEARERAATAFVHAAAPTLVQAVLDNVDLNTVLARVDVQRLVARIDMQEILRQVDLDEVIAGIDLDRALDRVDLNRLIAKLDLTEIIRSVDFASVAEDVMEEIDFGEIIRESTMSVGSESVEALRYQGVRADGLLVDFMDRILRRRGGRTTELRPGGGDR